VTNPATGEETSGPLAPVVGFGSEDKAEAMANDTGYGRAASNCGLDEYLDVKYACLGI